MKTLTTSEMAAVKNGARPAAPVWVLAADGDVVVRFDDWQVVNNLYRFVSELQVASQAVRRLGDLRVLGAAVEVDSPAVRAWRVGGDVVPQAAVECSLGDGALLRAAGAEAIPLAEESALRMVILRVCDDGMLIVDDGDGEEATIDLTELAAVGRGEKRGRCAVCKGTGWMEYAHPDDEGGTMMVVGPCPECIHDERCPACGQGMMVWGALLICVHCGFSFDEAVAPVVEQGW